VFGQNRKPHPKEVIERETGAHAADAHKHPGHPRAGHIQAAHSGVDLLNRRDDRNPVPLAHVVVRQEVVDQQIID
jgi:hypothetical protein